MADNKNHDMQQPPQLCKQGCGFFGSSNFDGMCSKCYKEFVQRQSNIQGVSLGRASPSASSLAQASAITGLSPSIGASSSSQTLDMPAAATALASIAASVSESLVSEAVEAQTKQVDAQIAQLSSEAATASASQASGAMSGPTRCLVCKKKIGLTGFECRCGGKFCGDHRYSDRHGCTFDYRTHAATQLRKDNPVVVANKLSKI